MHETIEASRDDDGEEIKRLLLQSGFNREIADAIDWCGLGGSWLVARHGRKIVGCLQIGLSRPIARLEYLATDEGLSHVSRGRVVKRLFGVACAMLRERGVQAISGLIAFTDTSWKEIAEKRSEIVTTGHIFMKRL